MLLVSGRPASAPLKLEWGAQCEPVIVTGFGGGRLSVISQTVQKYSFCKPDSQMLVESLFGIFSRVFGWSEAYHGTVEALAKMIVDKKVCSIICKAVYLAGGTLVSEEILMEHGGGQQLLYRSDDGYIGGNKPFDLERYFISMLKKTAIVFFTVKPLNSLETSQRTANLSAALEVILSANALKAQKAIGRPLIEGFKGFFKELDEFFGSEVVCSTLGLRKVGGEWCIVWSSVVSKEEELTIAALRANYEKVCYQWKLVGRTDFVVENQGLEARVCIRIFPFKELRPTPQRKPAGSPRLITKSPFELGL